MNVGDGVGQSVNLEVRAKACAPRAQGGFNQVGIHMFSLPHEVYPAPEHSVYMKDDQLLKFAQEMKWDSKLEQIELARQK